jgi:glycosyltransferase involved in cell wall biosynthesis
VRFDDPRRLTVRWALATPVDVLHLHWLEYLTGSHMTERWHGPKLLLRAARLLAVVAVLKARRVRLVWSVHNLRPHDARHPRFDLAMSRIIARLADRIIASSHYAAGLVRDVYRVDRVTVGYHGTLEGEFPTAERDRAQARRALGIPEDAHVLLAFGLIRAYKQIPQLITEFRALPDAGLRLIVAGRPLPASVGEAVRAAAGDDARIVLLLDHVPDEQVSELHLAADVAVLPYRDVFSSSALLLALSLGLPVVARAGTTADEVAAPDALVAYRDGELAAALARTRGMDRARAREAALSSARRFPWSATAERVLACYR